MSSALLPGRARPRYDTLQAGRGIAASLVVLSHAATVLGNPRHIGVDPTSGWAGFGHAGVDFFFVLSGFIIATVHAADIGRPGVALDYLRKRLVRIYPTWWAVLAITCILAALGLTRSIGIAPQDLTASRLAGSFLLLPQRQPPLVGNAWTLQHELLFYAVFGLVILHRRIGIAVAALWFGLTLAEALWGPPNLLPWAPSNLLHGFVLSSYHLQFLAGLAVAYAVRRQMVHRPTLVAALGLILFTAGAVAETKGWILSLGPAGQALYGAGAALMIAGLSAGEAVCRFHPPQPAIFLGDASYAIYLVHPVAITLACELFCPTGPVAPGVGLMLAASLIATGIAAGIAVHLAVERPLLVALRLTRSAP